MAVASESWRSPRSAASRPSTASTSRGAADMNPTTASSLLINAYVAQLERKVGWDFEDESPGRDARGFAREGSMPPEVETHLVNAVLTNGARYYVDHAHPEYSTPECSNAARGRPPRPGRRARSWPGRWRPPSGCSPGRGDRDLQEQLRRQGQLLRSPRELSHGPGRSVLEDRPPSSPPHFVTRQIYTGAGKVGEEADPGESHADVPDHASGPTSSRRRSASRRRSSGRSSTPVTSRTPTRRSTGACT